MSIDLSSLTIAEARESLKAKKISAQELTEEYLRVIEEKNEKINAYLEVFEDARAQAKEADKKIARGEAGVLLGIPLAMKDNILIEGRRISAASKILEGYVATYDATVTARLKKEGAVFLGRTNMDEFAMGSSTENSAFGVTKNPLDVERVPGGSSGGSAAAVAMGGALAAFGSDTGGSIRQPAALCGLVGLKPTYGAVSRYGLIAMGSSLDQIGPITKTVADAEELFEVIRGKDAFDSTTFPDGTYAKRNVPKRIGVPRSFLKEGLTTEVEAIFENALKVLAKKGYEIIDVELPLAARGLAAYYIVMPAEVSTNLARFDGVRYGLRKEGEGLLGDYLETRGAGFGAEVRRRIILGTYVLSAGYYDAYYGKAEGLRRSLTEEYNNAFASVDLIVTPTTPGAAFKIGEKSDPLAMYLEDIFSVPANLTGLPALSLSMGNLKVGSKELPVGMQFTAPHGDEGGLFHVGKDFEKEGV